MAVFITLTTDAFADTFNTTRAAAQAARRAGTDRARRPLRGLEVKDDTYSIIKVVRADGSEIPLIDSGSSTGTSTSYSNFILQSVSEARMEKHQIVETFGEPYIFFFGESPRFLDVTAVLVDSNDFNWYAEFWANYDQYLRGTKLVEQGARTYLFYDDNIVEGYMLMANARKVSDQPLMAQLSFRLYLTNYTNVSFVGDPNFPIRASVNLPPSVDLTTADIATVGSAAATAATQAALNDAAANQAGTGAQQQAGGFGGGQNLSDALRSGVTSTGDPFTDGVLLNALEALAVASGEQRSMPLRGLISDNTDEFTAYPPQNTADPQPGAGPPDGSGDEEQDQAGQPDTPDLTATITAQAGQYGGDVNNPSAVAQLGIGVNFTAQVGFGVSGSAGAGASFGVSGGASFGASYGGGINGGLGFTGTFTACPTLSASISFGAGGSPLGGVPGPSPAQLNAQASANALGQSVLQAQFGANVYGNGILVQGGVSSGTGIGGGIPGGISGGLDADGNPGGLVQFTGGTSFSTDNGYGSSFGYGSGLSGNGASISVGGAPSAFATVAAPGTYNPAGAASVSFSIGG